MKRQLEPDGEPDITRGTMEGDIKAGDITFFRLQTTASTQLRAYVAPGAKFWMFLHVPLVPSVSLQFLK